MLLVHAYDDHAKMRSYSLSTLYMVQDMARGLRSSWVLLSAGRLRRRLGQVGNAKWEEVQQGKRASLTSLARPERLGEAFAQKTETMLHSDARATSVVGMAGREYKKGGCREARVQDLIRSTSTCVVSASGSECNFLI